MTAGPSVRTAGAVLVVVGVAETEGEAVVAEGDGAIKPVVGMSAAVLLETVDVDTWAWVEDKNAVDKRRRKGNMCLRIRT